MVVPNTKAEVAASQPQPIQWVERVRQYFTVEIPKSYTKRPRQLVDKSFDLDWSKPEKKDPSSSSESLPPPLSSKRKSNHLSAQSKKVAPRKLAVNEQKVWTSPIVSASPSRFFKSNSHGKLWASVSKRTLVDEGTLHSKDFKHSGIEELLGKKNMLGTVSKMPSFVPQIVLEFYMNLSKNTGDPASPNFKKRLCKDTHLNSPLASSIIFGNVLTSQRMRWRYPRLIQRSQSSQEGM